jgi:hypothetical protein
MIWTFKAVAIWKTKNMKLRSPAFSENMAMGIQTFTNYILSSQKLSMILSTAGVLNWEDISKNVIIAGIQSMHTTPAVTGIAPNVSILSRCNG